MNTNRIINLPAPLNPTDPVRLQDIAGTLVVNPVLATANLYMSPTGSDSNTGFTVDSPLLTLQKAANIAIQYSLGGLNITINMANGTYGAGAVFSGIPAGSANGLVGGSGQIIITGASAGSAIINDISSAPATIIALFGVQVSVQNMTITSLNGSALFPSYGAVINVQTGLVFGQCALGHLHAETFGAVRIVSSYKISGNAPAHIQAVLGGYVVYVEGGIVVTLQGAPGFSTAFVDCESGSVVYCNNSFVTFSGSGTGLRYFISGNSIVETIAGTATYFPGDTNGRLTTGGCLSPSAAVTSVNGLTGLGASGSATVINGSSANAGIVQLTVAGAAPAASGSFTVNIPGSWGQHNAAFIATLFGAWGLQAAVVATSSTSTSVTFTWSNNGVALTAGNYFVSYSFIPLPT